ncbi:hypothetical protein LC612_37450 [Nostoc sp. CHAB 5834]|nr:hypothetical protein [Nostoc sp. CHAB 5834]
MRSLLQLTNNFLRGKGDRTPKLRSPFRLAKSLPEKASPLFLEDIQGI